MDFFGGAVADKAPQTANEWIWHTFRGSSDVMEYSTSIKYYILRATEGKVVVSFDTQVAKPK